MQKHVRSEQSVRQTVGEDRRLEAGESPKAHRAKPRTESDRLATDDPHRLGYGSITQEERWPKR